MVLEQLQLKHIITYGQQVNVGANWVYANQVYGLLWNANINGFVLIFPDNNRDSYNNYIITHVTELLALTSSSSASAIAAVYDNDTSTLVSAAISGLNILIANTTNHIETNYNVTYDLSGDNVTNVILEFITGGYWYRHNYAVSTSTGLITGVTVDKCEINIPNGNNMSF